MKAGSDARPCAGNTGWTDNGKTSADKRRLQPVEHLLYSNNVEMAEKGCLITCCATVSVVAFDCLAIVKIGH